jgi:hypothetical protein
MTPRVRRTQAATPVPCEPPSGAKGVALAWGKSGMEISTLMIGNEYVMCGFDEARSRMAAIPARAWVMVMAGGRPHGK